MLRAEIADILGIANIADSADVADIGMDIADIGTDIMDIAMGITDVVNSADIADRMLRTLQWKQVDAYKVLRGCPVTLLPTRYSLTVYRCHIVYILLYCIRRRGSRYL